jgi:hypothetical protein
MFVLCCFVLDVYKGVDNLLNDHICACANQLHTYLLSLKIKTLVILFVFIIIYLSCLSLNCSRRVIVYFKRKSRKKSTIKIFSILMMIQKINHGLVHGLRRFNAIQASNKMHLEAVKTKKLPRPLVQKPRFSRKPLESIFNKSVR